MIDNLESNYDCANAGDDLHKLKEELAALRGRQGDNPGAQEEINRLENQIAFIMNQCHIH